MSLRTKIKEDGYVILTNVFTEDQIINFRNVIHRYCANKFKNIHGKSIIDPINKHPIKEINIIKNNTIINNALTEIFNTNDYRFCQHNDIGIDRIVGWHKDKLNGVYSNFQKIDIWNTYQNQEHEIVKVAIYLQNHDTDMDGLRIIPKSHLNRHISIDNPIHIDIKIGDVLIFDQRITHRGPKNIQKKRRTLISLGFGKNNIFTDQFQLGTEMRQKNKKYFDCQLCSIKKRKKCKCKKK